MPDLLTQQNFPADAINGNMFSFIFAGHGANANTLIFAVFLLACHLKIQAQTQAEIDSHGKVVRTIDSDETDHSSSYQDNFRFLRDGLVGAVINETLRLFTILLFVLKATPKATVALIFVEGKHVVLSIDTLVLINTSAAHRHPKCWPHRQGQCLGSPPVGCAPYPVVDFNPDH